MNFLDDPFQLVRLALKVLSAVFGGVGVFSIYASMYVPKVGVIAVLMLSVAATMVRLCDENQ